MTPTLLNGIYAGKKNVSGGIYIYDTADDDGSAEPDSSINQVESPNKTSDLYIPVDGVASFLHGGKTLTDKISVLRHGAVNVILTGFGGSGTAGLQLAHAAALKSSANFLWASAA